MEQLIVIGVIIVGFIIYDGIVIVGQQTVSVIELFGKFNRVLESGLNFKIPLLEKVASVLSMRIQQLDVYVETKTHDNVFVKIKVAVQFAVIETKIYEACYKLYSPLEQIEAFVFDVVRAKVPNIDLDALFAKKDEIAIDVKNELDETMQGFGYQIVKALVTDIEPNENVKNAMNEINTAQRLRVAAGEKAEAEKIIRIKQAEGEAEANILHGKGLAGQRRAIIDGLGESLDLIQQHSPGMSAADIMSSILTIQYFDALRDLGANGKTNTLFLSHSPSQAVNAKDQILETLIASNRSNPSINLAGSGSVAGSGAGSASGSGDASGSGTGSMFGSSNS